MPRKKKTNHTHAYFRAVAIGAFTLLAVIFIATAAGVNRTSKLAFILVPWEAPTLADTSDCGLFCNAATSLTEGFRMLTSFR